MAITRRWKQYNLLRLVSKEPDCLLHFEQNWILSTDSHKCPQYQKSKMRQVRTMLLHADRQTDRHVEANRRLPPVCERAVKHILRLCSLSVSLLRLSCNVALSFLQSHFTVSLSTLLAICSYLSILYNLPSSYFFKFDLTKQHWRISPHGWSGAFSSPSSAER